MKTCDIQRTRLDKCMMLLFKVGYKFKNDELLEIWNCNRDTKAQLNTLASKFSLNIKDIFKKYELQLKGINNSKDYIEVVSNILKLHFNVPFEWLNNINYSKYKYDLQKGGLEFAYDLIDNNPDDILGYNNTKLKKDIMDIDKELKDNQDKINEIINTKYDNSRLKDYLVSMVNSNDYEHYKKLQGNDNFLSNRLLDSCFLYIDCAINTESYNKDILSLCKEYISNVNLWNLKSIQLKIENDYYEEEGNSSNRVHVINNESTAI